MCCLLVPCVSAVSGTERQHVAYNYAYLLAKGAVSSDQLIAQSLAKLSTTQGSPLTFTQCPLANVSLCAPTQSGAPTAILVYNSQSRNQSFLVRFPVNASMGSVYDANGTLSTSYVVYPVQPTEATAIGGAGYEVLAEVEEPAMGWTTLFWQASQAGTETGLATEEDEVAAENRHNRMRVMMQAAAAAAKPEDDSDADPLRYGAGRWQLNFDDGGLLASVLDTRTNHTIALRQEFLYYNSMQVTLQNSHTLTLSCPFDNRQHIDLARPTLSCCLLLIGRIMARTAVHTSSDPANSTPTPSRTAA